MSESAVDDIVALLPPLLTTIDALAFVGRYLNPQDFDAVIARGMAKEPRQRYASTVELASAAHDAITTPIAKPARSAQPRPPAAATADSTATLGASQTSEAGRQRRSDGDPTQRQRPFADSTSSRPSTRW